MASSGAKAVAKGSAARSARPGGVRPSPSRAVHRQAPRTAGIEGAAMQRAAQIRLEIDGARKATGRPLKDIQALATRFHATGGLSDDDRNWVLNADLVDAARYRPSRRWKYDIADVVMLLLMAGDNKPIIGRIAMTKQVFLAVKEVFDESGVQKIEFVPYRYGPYSFVLSQAVSDMVHDGILSVHGRKNTSSERFTLTKKGMRLAKNIDSKLDPPLRNMLVERRKSWDQCHTGGLLAYVYNKYPEYTDKSAVKKKYRSITWGRGKG